MCEGVHAAAAGREALQEARQEGALCVCMLHAVCCVHAACMLRACGVLCACGVLYLARASEAEYKAARACDLGTAEIAHLDHAIAPEAYVRDVSGM